jgi:site-specific recombinase XerD
MFSSWQIALRAARLAPGTIKTYGDGVNQYLAWCEANDVPPMVRANLGLWVAGLLDDGAAPATARTRQLGVRRFAKWLTTEGELPADPFLGLPPPKLDETVIEPLTEDELRAMLKACVPAKGAGTSEVFRGRRDEAVLRFMLETGTRAGEVVALAVDDVDFSAGTAIVRRGKGGKGRSMPSLMPEATASQWGRLGAHISWANTTDRAGRTAPARAALDQKFLDDRGACGPQT